MCVCVCCSSLRSPADTRDAADVSAVRVAAVGALARMARSSEECRRRVQNCGGMDVLVEAVERGEVTAEDDVRWVQAAAGRKLGSLK